MALKQRDRARIPRLSRSSSAVPEPEIGQALAEHGVLLIDEHLLGGQSVRRAAEASRRAFALPEAIKESYQGPIDGTQRGYLPVRTELPDGRDALDRKEAWHARPEGHAAENLFPREVPEFGPSLLALFEGLEATTSRVLRGIGAYLGRAPGFFEEQVRDGDSLFRVNHYPDTTAGGKRARFHAHQDFDLITLLLGASGPGLEVQTRGGEWRSVEDTSGAIVATVGDLLEIESEGKIRSTPHRVKSPDDSDGGRLSMVYFVSPRHEVILTGGRSAGEIVDDRLRQAGYA
jgi:isopenicillin N synthase-like dioxygenase